LRVVAIIQARMGSTRLPGKILFKVLNKTLLEYQLERVKKSTLVDEIVVATTIQKNDDVIVKLCEQLNVSVFRGSEEDVLSRYYGAATEYKADVIVRLTSDCPIIDHNIIDLVIHTYIENIDVVDYVSNTLERTFPRGYDTEVFSYLSLQKSNFNAIMPSQREHVTSFLYSNPEIYCLKNVFNVVDQSNYRWTVDTIEDFELIKKIITRLYPVNQEFTLHDSLQLFKKNVEWGMINAHVEQKKIGC
jgi:spore coat polysaccharide biosynthesis protein SpsF